MNKFFLTLYTIAILFSASILNAQENKEDTSFQIKPIGIKIDNLKDNQSTINIGNLKIGQSGIVVHSINEDKKLIVANAQVIKSNENTSVIKFTKYKDLKQDALPTYKGTAKIGDILVLNYLYTKSLLIVPSQETFLDISNKFEYNNFLHTDIFAAYLKIKKSPYPSKKDIQDFAISQNLGTIFVLTNQKIYIYDTKSFKLLASFDYKYDIKNNQKPFYTRVEKIDAALFSASLKKGPSYEEHYKKILGL